MNSAKNSWKELQPRESLAPSKVDLYKKGEKLWRNLYGTLQGGKNTNRPLTTIAGGVCTVVEKEGVSKKKEKKNINRNPKTEGNAYDRGCERKEQKKKLT